MLLFYPSREKILVHRSLVCRGLFSKHKDIVSINLDRTDLERRNRRYRLSVAGNSELYICIQSGSKHVHLFDEHYETYSRILPLSNGIFRHDTPQMIRRLSFVRVRP